MRAYVFSFGVQVVSSVKVGKMLQLIWQTIARQETLLLIHLVMHVQKNVKS